MTEGGIRAPLIVAGPGVNHRGDVTQSVLHVTDIVPTLLELAGTTHPSATPGSTLAPLHGKSLQPLLAGRTASVRTDEDWLGWELFGNRAIRQGDWKLLSLMKEAGGTGDWQLFDLRADPAELHDLSPRHPEKRKALEALWDEYAKENGVIVTGDGPFRKTRADAASSSRFSPVRVQILPLIGVTLIAEGFDQHFPKGYVYFAMAFSVFVEMLNLRMRTVYEPPVRLHEPY